MNKDHKLKEGAVYSIRCSKDLATEGEFLGYVMVGSNPSLVIRNEKGMFYISSSSIKYMKLVENVPDKRSESVKDNYYG